MTLANFLAGPNVIAPNEALLFQYSTESFSTAG